MRELERDATLEFLRLKAMVRHLMFILLLFAPPPFCCSVGVGGRFGGDWGGVRLVVLFVGFRAFL